MPDEVTQPALAPPALTPQEQAMSQAYFEAVLEAFNQKALQYYQGAGNDPKEQFKRVTQIKDGLKTIGKSSTFGIAAGPYSSCPSGVCTGGVCTSPLAFGDSDLASLAQKLGLEDIV